MTIAGTLVETLVVHMKNHKSLLKSFLKKEVTDLLDARPKILSMERHEVRGLSDAVQQSDKHLV